MKEDLARRLKIINEYDIKEGLKNARRDWICKVTEERKGEPPFTVVDRPNDAEKKAKEAIAKEKLKKEQDKKKKDDQGPKLRCNFKSCSATLFRTRRKCQRDDV
jgi:hypothetical protein